MESKMKCTDCGKDRVTRPVKFIDIDERPFTKDLCFECEREWVHGAYYVQNIEQLDALLAARRSGKLDPSFRDGTNV
jgi:ribosomal protein L37AE/L43A